MMIVTARMPRAYRKLMLLATVTTASCARAVPSEQPPTRTIEFVTEEVSRSSVDISPDGQTIIFDVLGDIYTVSVGGGDATPLLTGRHFDSNPRFSPDGTQIAFLSDRAGGKPAIWTARVDGSEPEFYAEFTGPAPYVQVGDSMPVPAWMVPAHFPLRDVPGQPWLSGRQSPDGRWVAFAKRDGYASRTSLMLHDVESGKDRVLLDSVTPMTEYAGFRIPDYAFTPDSRSIILSNFGKLTRVDLATGAQEWIPLRVHVRQEIPEPISPRHRIAQADSMRVRVLRWPVLTPDGRRVIYSALGKLYVTETATGATRRLTTSDEFEHAPALSPDGRWLAYVTWSDSALGAVLVMPAEGGTPRRLTPELGRYTNPVWSSDGQKIAFIRDPDDQEIQKRSKSPEIHWVPALDSAVAPSRVGSIMRYRVGMPTREFTGIAFIDAGERLAYLEEDGSSDYRDIGTSARRLQRLVSIRLDGSDRRVHLRLFPAVDEAVISPDGRQLALARHERVMVMPFPQGLEGPDELIFAGPGASTAPLTMDIGEGGTFLAWQSPEVLTWNAGTRIYRQRLAAEGAELAVDVNLHVRRARPEGVVAFTNARLITMRGDEVLEGTIVVTGDRITAIGPKAKIPPGAHLIDATGKTIIPGLNDTHSHVHLSRGPREIFTERKWDYLTNLAYGVTTLYDPSVPLFTAFGQAEMVEAGAMLGPRVYSSGDGIFDDDWGYEHLDYQEINSLEDARSIVRRYTRYGYVMLKQYRRMRRDQRQWLAEAARETGVRITAEGRNLEYDLTLVLDGYTSFEHPIWTPALYDDAIQFFARSGVHMTADVLTSGLDRYYGQREASARDPKLFRFTPSVRLSWPLEPIEQPLPVIDADSIKKTKWFRDLTISARITHAGGSVNAATHSSPDGIGLHWGMWGLVMGGMTPHEALRSATISPARKLGFEQDLGSLEVGKLADFMVLEKNPLEDIRNSISIRHVVAGGFVYEAESLTRIWPSHNPLGPYYWQSATHTGMANNAGKENE